MINYVSILTTVEATTEHLYPDGSVQTSDMSVTGNGDVAFGWFGQLMNWLQTQTLPLPGGYHITFLQVGIACVFLYILGWMLGRLISGRRGD